MRNYIDKCADSHFSARSVKITCEERPNYTYVGNMPKEKTVTVTPATHAEHTWMPTSTLMLYPQNTPHCRMVCE